MPAGAPKRPTKKPAMDRAVYPTSGAKINDDICRAIVLLVSSGVPQSAAAAAARIGRRTLQRWISLGRKTTNKKSPYRQLYLDVKKAEADAITRNVAIIQKAASKSWTAAAWWLERRYPGDFGINRKEMSDLRSKVSELESRLGSTSVSQRIVVGIVGASPDKLINGPVAEAVREAESQDSA